jgi:predicted transcriptional regulator
MIGIMKQRQRPTDSELAILRVLWNRGPSTVRQVQDELSKNKDTGYTTVLKFMQIMVEKGLLRRDDSPYAHIYEARVPREQTQRNIVADLLDRVFDGSMSRLVVQALAAKRATTEELSEIRKILKKYERGGQ